MSHDVFRSIVEHNRAREADWLSPLACRSDVALRRDPHAEKVPDLENIRSPFYHDTDRILHSMAYTRYIDKTQVFYLFENDLITHRVLHVQFVAKIARTIGRCLRLNEDLTEAIALGHDLGHVPFGHDGEMFLDEICAERGVGAFCHNAQSVRWMMELERRGAGLNLCLQTLDGMLSHNGELWERTMRPRRGKTWDDFEAEYRACMADKNAGRALRPMTLEGCVVRFADIIAYVGRDVEDAIKLEVLRREDLPRAATDVLGDRNSEIINTLVLNLIENSMEQDYIAYSEEVHAGLDALIQFNYEAIYKNPRVRESDDKLRHLFRALFDDGLSRLEGGEDDGASGIRQFARWRDPSGYARETPPERIAIDYIAGMTDDYFLSQARRILLPRGFGEKAPRRELVSD